MARMLVIGTARHLRRTVAELEALGYEAKEEPGAIHHGRGVWTVPLLLTPVRSTEEPDEPLPPLVPLWEIEDPEVHAFAEAMEEWTDDEGADAPA